MGFANALQRFINAAAALCLTSIPEDWGSILDCRHPKLQFGKRNKAIQLRITQISDVDIYVIQYSALRSLRFIPMRILVRSIYDAATGNDAARCYSRA